MANYLQTICPQYEKAELTCLFLHNRKTQKFYHLFAITELVPAEQASSSLIGNAAVSFLDRESLDNEWTIYIGRVPDLSVQQAVSIYQDAANGIPLRYKDTLNADITLFETAKLESEPPGDHPLVVNKQQTRYLAPYYPTATQTKEFGQK